MTWVLGQGSVDSFWFLAAETVALISWKEAYGSQCCQFIYLRSAVHPCATTWRGLENSCRLLDKW